MPSPPEIAQRPLGDFDFCRHLSQFFLYVTGILRRLQSFHLKPPVSILTHPIQDREVWFVIRAGFHPQDAFDNRIYSNFLNRHLNQIPTPLV